MGPSKVRDRIPDLILRACRLPRKVAGRMSEMSSNLYEEHIRLLRSERVFSFKFLAAAILLLTYLPSMMMLNPVAQPQVEFASENEVDDTAYCHISHISEAGVTHAVLLNSTPFNPAYGWEIDISSPYGYDFNRYVRNESDGYHLEYPPVFYTYVTFRRQMQVPLFNYSDISIAVEVEGLSGSAGISLEVFADEASERVEAPVPAGQTAQVNVSAPLAEARLQTTSWLGTVAFNLHTASDSGAQIVVRSVIVTATFTGKLSRVRLDPQSTENISLYENPYTNHLGIVPRIMIVQNNDSSSAAVFILARADDEIYLAPGIYEGMVFWPVYNYDFHYERPDPTNATSWAPKVNFTVPEDVALEIDVRVFVLRIDINLSHDVLLYLGWDFRGPYTLFGFSESLDIVGSTVYSHAPDHLYIPGGVGRLTVRITTWSADSRYISWYKFRISAETYLDASNCSRNLELNIVFPYVAVGAAVLGLGDFVVLIVVGLLLIWFAICLHRAFRHSDLRHALSDSKLLPIILLGLGILLPWSTQLWVSQSPSYPTAYRISWFSKPFVILWSDSTAIQMFCATGDWWYASLLSTFLLFVPFFYVCSSLSSPETGKFNRGFALALLLPYLVVLSAFNFSVVSPDTISIGPLLIMAAFPVWLVRIALRRLGITK